MKRRLCVFAVLAFVGVFGFALSVNNLDFQYTYTYMVPRNLNNELIEPDEVTIIRVIDGDTVKIDFAGTEESLRLIGVDTPETVHPSKPVEEFGKEASDFLSKICLVGQTAYLTFDQSLRDKYNRLLGYLWVKADTDEWVLVNVAIIFNGFGHSYTAYSFRGDYMALFNGAEKAARLNKYGLWGESEEEQEAVSQPISVSEPTTTTYIGNKNSKVFHRTSCRYLPDPKNRVYFSSRSAAISAGYRPCGHCKP